MEWAALHKAELLEDWELARRQAPLKPIEPLGIRYSMTAAICLILGLVISNAQLPRLRPKMDEWLMLFQVGRQLVVGLVGVARERLRHGAGRLVVHEVDGTGACRPGGRVSLDAMPGRREPLQPDWKRRQGPNGARGKEKGKFVRAFSPKSDSEFHGKTEAQGDREG